MIAARPGGDGGAGIVYKLDRWTGQVEYMHTYRTGVVGKLKEMCTAARRHAELRGNVMKKIIALIATLCVVSGPAYARWERAMLQDSGRSTGGYYQCTYETMGGYRFSVKLTEHCPYAIEVDEESGQFRKI